MISHNGKTIARTIGADHDPVRGEPWQARAACAGEDTELFYPVGRHETNDPVWDEPRSICLGCPVRNECVNDAILHDDAWGMRGGLTPAQLARLVARPCRTCSAVAVHGRLYCQACADAQPEGRNRAGDLPCATCGEIRRVKARGLCHHCWESDMRTKRVAS